MEDSQITSSQQNKKKAMKCLQELAYSFGLWIFGGYPRDSISGELPTDLDIAYKDQDQVVKMIVAMRFFFNVEIIDKNKTIRDSDDVEDYPIVFDEYNKLTKHINLDSYNVTSLMVDDVSFKIDFIPQTDLEILLDLNENGLVFESANKLVQRAELSLVDTIQNIINKNFTLTTNALRLLSEGTNIEKVHLYYRISKMLERGWVPKDKKITDISRNFVMTAGLKVQKCLLCNQDITDMFYFNPDCCNSGYHFKCLKSSPHGKCVECHKSVFVDKNVAIDKQSIKKIIEQHNGPYIAIRSEF